MENKKNIPTCDELLFTNVLLNNHRLKELSEPTGQKWNNHACERTSYDAGFKLGLGGFKFTQGYDCDQIKIFVHMNEDIYNQFK
jgi:hypothetical protein